MSDACMSDAAGSLDLVQAVVARLKAAPGAADAPLVQAGLQLGEKTPHRIPALLVYPVALDGSESASPRVGAYQRMTVTLALVHVVAARNTPRRAGRQAIDPLDALLGWSRGLLNGWRPEGHERRQDALVLRRGRLVDITDGRALWRDEYNCSWRVANCPGS